jgi:hypothetical protein
VPRRASFLLPQCLRGALCHSRPGSACRASRTGSENAGTPMWARKAAEVVSTGRSLMPTSQSLRRCLGSRGRQREAEGWGWSIGGIGARGSLFGYGPHRDAVSGDCHSSLSLLVDLDLDGSRGWQGKSSARTQRVRRVQRMEATRFWFRLAPGRDWFGKRTLRTYGCRESKVPKCRERATISKSGYSSAGLEGFPQLSRTLVQRSRFLDFIGEGCLNSGRPHGLAWRL